MHQAVQKFEGFMIYAAAFEGSPSGGFTARVVLTTARSGGRERTELFRDELLLDGRVWLDPSMALDFAVNTGQAAVSERLVLYERGICPYQRQTASASA